MGHYDKTAHDLFQIYLLYNRKGLLNFDSTSAEGFSRSHFDFLLILDEMGEMPMSSVARELSYSKAYITALADFLHSKNLLKRVPNTEDRRVILVSLSDHGRRFVKEHRETVESAIENRMALLKPEEADRLAGQVSETVRILSLLPDSDEARSFRKPPERRKTMMEPTTKYFPVLIENLEMIPEMFMEKAKSLLTSAEFPYCIHIPEYVSNIVKYPGWLIMMDDQRITVLKDSLEEPAGIQLPFREITYLERGCILLNSWLDIKALDSGRLVTARIEFNTTREDLMQPIIDRIRESYSHPGADYRKTESALAFLKTDDLKFYNFAHPILFPGSDYDQVIYQREIDNPTRKFIKQDYLDAHLTLIGQNELVDIAESGRIDSAGTRNIGAIWRYIPRKAVRKTALIEHEAPKTIELTLELEAGQMISLIYEARFKTQLETLIN